MFKKVFLDDKEKLKNFIESVIKRKVLNIEFLSNEQFGKFKEAKKGIVDILAVIEEKDGSKKQVNIEVQVKNVEGFKERSFLYFCRAYENTMGDSKDYKDCIPVIQIIIVVSKQLKRNTYHSIAKIKFEEIQENEFVDFKYVEEDEYLYKDVEFHIIELNKFKKKDIDVNNKLELWLLLFLGNEEKILEYIEIDKQFKEVYEKMKYLSINDYETRAVYESELKFLRDEYTNKAAKDRIEAEKNNLEAEKNNLEAEIDKMKSEKDKIESEKDKMKSEKDKMKSEKDKIESEKEYLKISLVKVLISQKIIEEEILEKVGITKEELEDIIQKINKE